MDLPSLSATIAPTSGASSGMDYNGGHGAVSTGPISIGGAAGAGGGPSMFTAIVRDMVIGMAATLATKYLWKMIK